MTTITSLVGFQTQFHEMTAELFTIRKWNCENVMTCLGIKRMKLNHAVRFARFSNGDTTIFLLLVVLLNVPHQLRRARRPKRHFTLNFD